MSLLGSISKGLRSIVSPIVKSIPVVGPGLGQAIDLSLVNTTKYQRGEVPGYMGGSNVYPCPPGQRAVPGGGCIADPTYGKQPISLGNYGGQVMTGNMIPFAGTALRTIGGSVSRGLMRTSTGRISAIVLGSGQKFSRKKAAALIRKVGFEVAATALGISLYEAAELLLTDTKTRRRRGITAAQVANARRTSCMVARLARDLGVKPAPARRARSCR